MVMRWWPRSSKSQRASVRIVSAPSPSPCQSVPRKMSRLARRYWGVGLFACLREPDHLPVELDGEHELGLVGLGNLEDVLLCEAEPPAGDLGLRGDSAEP
jgi:hypothetical protein